jgi:hypothetical protein
MCFFRTASWQPVEWVEKVKVFRKHLCDHTYWTRAWITQEIRLARKLWLFAGDMHVNADTVIESHCTVPALVYARQKATTMSLLDLLRSFRYRQCKIKRDRIYSLLALCGEGSQIPVDYISRDQEVLKQVLRVCIGSAYLCSTALHADTLEISAIEDGAILFRGAHVSRHVKWYAEMRKRVRMNGPSWVGHESTQIAAILASSHEGADLCGFWCTQCHPYVLINGRALGMNPSGNTICLAACSWATVHVFWNVEEPRTRDP